MSLREKINLDSRLAIVLVSSLVLLLYFSLIKNNRPNGIIGDPIGRILYSNQGAILRSSESSIWEPAERSVEIFGNEVLRSGSGQVKIEFYESKVKRPFFELGTEK